MPQAPSRRNLPLLLLRSREGVMSHFRAILNQHGLTEQQWRVLRALLDESPLEPRQICETCQLLSASATGVLARKVMPLVDAQYRQLEQALGAELLDRVYDTLDQLLLRLAQLPAGDG